MMYEEGHIFYCPNCGLEVRILKVEHIPISALECCKVEMEPIKADSLID